jgi:hypothetical protein
MRSVDALLALGVGMSMMCLGCGSSEQAGEPASSSGAAAGQGNGGSGGSAGSNASGGSSGTQAPPIPIGDLCPIFTSDLCIYLMQCQGARYADAEHCERELDCFGMQELLAAAERGAVDYDPSKVGECHERFIDSPCTFGFFLFTPDIYEVLSYCPGTVTPRLTAGETCSSDGECVDGLYCYKGADYQCPGTCRAYSLQGETCAGSARCAEGLECGAENSCAPEAKAGDPCDGFCNSSSVCIGDGPCPTNLWCDTSVGQCKTGLLEGEACGDLGGDTIYEAECAINLWCDAVGSSGTGTCRAPGADGAPCNDEYSACDDGLHCSGYEPYGAAPKLGTCTGPAPSEAPCTSNDDCQAGLTCVAQKCTPPAGALGTCEDTADCAPGLLCRDLVCTDAPYPGEPCSETGPACAFSRCIAGTCEYHARVGEACASPDDCATGACVAGLCYDSSVCNAPE